MLSANKIEKTGRAGRVSRLRERIINAPREVCVERARYATQAFSKNWDLPPLTRMSLALEHILDNISVIIREGELIVGCRTSKLNAAPLFPENKSKWIEGDVDTFSTRFLQNALISADEQRELAEDLLPFWRGKTVEDDLNERMPEDIALDMDKYIFTMILEITYGVGHFTLDHERLLKKGCVGIADEARARMSAISGNSAADEEKRLFYDAVVRSVNAAVKFANRYAEAASKLADVETDSERVVELRDISRICRRVPEHTPESFHEAVQFVYFMHLISQIETGGNSISLGRIDQYLYPYYAKDMKEGRVTPERARELLSLLYLKTNEIWNVLEEAFIPGGEGPEGKTTQNVTVGGVGADGRDATNELSHIALDAYADVRTVQPNFSVRVGPEAPDIFFAKAAAYAQDGVLLHFFNDEKVIESLTRGGHALEDARDYGVVGCVEPNAQGKTFGSTFAVQFSGIKCLEFAMSDGVDNIFGYQSGIQTGDPADFEEFEDVWNAYAAQVSHFIGQMVRGMEVMDECIAAKLPSPFASATVSGPMEKGVDLTRGGAVYNSTGVQLIGFSNVADSLFAIKKAVYEDKLYSIGELAAWLSSDWDEGEDVRSRLLNKYPKFGNDNDEVDEMASRVIEHFCAEVVKHKNYRGGAFWPGVFSVGFHIAMGAFAGASADGRRAGDVLGNGVTPTNGNALNGPTAVANSVAKLPLSLVHNGVNLNMRFNPSKLNSSAFRSFIKTYLRNGGIQLQFNMTSAEELKAAQADPEKYRDLIVRVSGYSALFTGLSEIAQNEIISRTEYAL
ncbi:MAG TPA: formate C-acetyltransferase/glycerol dehydratase family glycyl radical enzyme [bacterium]|nr:formate C-acetyltransferase/glycerol dehydratase family glycyl radical enzyme [bacterium]